MTPAMNAPALFAPRHSDDIDRMIAAHPFALVISSGDGEGHDHPRPRIVAARAVHLLTESEGIPLTGDL